MADFKFRAGRFFVMAAEHNPSGALACYVLEVPEGRPDLALCARANLVQGNSGHPGWSIATRRGTEFYVHQDTVILWY